MTTIDSLKPEALKDYDLIGISSPLWGNHLPLNVGHFIASLPDEVAGKRTFFFYNEQIAFDYSLIRAVQALREKGLAILGWNDRRGHFTCPGAHPPRIPLICRMQRRLAQLLPPAVSGMPTATPRNCFPYCPRRSLTACMASGASCNPCKETPRYLPDSPVLAAPPL